MDTQRLILALALSAAVLVFWSYFFAPPPPKQKVKEEKKTAQPAKQGSVAVKEKAPQQAAKTPAASPTAPAAAKGKLAALAKTDAPDVVVDTPLFKAWFSARGGTLRKLLLKKFHQRLSYQQYMAQVEKQGSSQASFQGGLYNLLDFKPKQKYSLGLNILGADAALEDKLFAADRKSLQVAAGDKPQSLSFRAQSGGVEVVKTYTFYPDTYGIGLKVTLGNKSSVQMALTPELKLRDLARKAEGNTYAFTGVRVRTAAEQDKFKPDDLAEDQGKRPKRLMAGAVNWVSMSVPWFMSAVAPLPPKKGTRPKMVVAGFREGDIMGATLGGYTLRLAAGQYASLNYQLYFGPQDLKQLEPLGLELVRAVDFGFFDLLAKPILALMNWLYSFLGNYGLAIILITLLTKVLFWPLTRKSYKSMKEMQKLQPQLQQLRERYKDDKQKLNQEMMGLYRSHKVNPFGGCLPMIVQIPVFIAFYSVLGEAVELRFAPFGLWINDLSAPDRLWPWLGIPYVNGIPILTLLMGASMFLQQKMTPAMGDPTQQKVMMLMPVVFTFIFINFPSGLVLYWLVNNLVSIGQQYFVNKRAA